MPKTFRAKLGVAVSRARLRRAGVTVHHHTAFSSVKFGHGTVVEPYCRMTGTPTITFGTDCYVNVGCHMLGEILIGNDVLIGPKVVIWGRDHGTAMGELIRGQKHHYGRISVGDDVWIGAGAIVLKGVSIGRGAVVGAGAIVTRDVRPNEIVGGNPARSIGSRR